MESLTSMVSSCIPFSSTWLRDMRDRRSSTDSAMDALSAVLPCASTATAVATASLTMSTSRLLSGACCLSCAWLSAASGFRIRRKIWSAREASSIVSTKGYTDSTSSSKTASRRATSSGVQLAQNSASVAGDPSSSIASPANGESARLDDSDVDLAESGAWMPIRVSERSATTSP